MSIPKVFISYSHDSIEHKKWTVNLAKRLMASGVDIILDQWELKPGDDLALFMEKNLDSANFIIMICTSTYVEKANAGKGGVGYEKMIITSNLLKNIDNRKVIPVIRQEGNHDVPIFLKTKLFINLSSVESIEFGVDELTRTIHNSPLLVKPVIGENPFENDSVKLDDEEFGISEALSGLIQVFAVEYNKSGEGLSFETVLKKMDISRIMLEFLFEEAVEKDFFVRWIGAYGLTRKGKFYCLQKGLG